MSSLDVVELAASDYPQWIGMNAASPGGSIYSDPRYLEVLCAATGDHFRVIAVRRAGELLGGIAVYEMRTSHGTRAGPRGLLYYHGPVLRRLETSYPSEQTAAHAKTMSALAGAMARRGYGAIVLKSPAAIADVRPFIDQGWSVRPSYTYVVPIADPPAQWLKVERNLRRLIKRCEERDGMVFSPDDDFEAFFALHGATLQRKQAAGYLPKAAFAAYFERLKQLGLAQIYHARLPDGRAVATQLVLLGPYTTSHTVCAGGDPAFHNTGAQAFLRWKAFEHLSRLGYHANDLTDAALNSVTHFKSQFGGTLEMPLVIEARPTLRYAAGNRAAATLDRGARLLHSLAFKLTGLPP